MKQQCRLNCALRTSDSLLKYGFQPALNQGRSKVFSLCDSSSITPFDQGAIEIAEEPNQTQEVM